MRIIAVIPARYAATRFPGKLMQKLGEQTVILTTYNHVKETKLFDDVFVVTDSELIFDEIIKNGGKAIRSIKEHETGSDRIAEVIENIDCDIILNVQGDEPFVNKKVLEDLIQCFKEDDLKTVDVATLKQKITSLEEVNNPNIVKVITDYKDMALYFSRSPIPYNRADLPMDYYRHIGVYAFRKNALLKFSQLKMRPLEIVEKLEQLRYLEYGMCIKVVETFFVGIGIDTPQDLENAKKLINQ